MIKIDIIKQFVYTPKIEVSSNKFGDIYVV